MSGTVKGIIVEIGGDTNGLQKALSKINSVSSGLSKELRGINSLLKLDPSNTVLVSQKQEILAENIAKTEDKIKSLKEAQEQADKIMAKGGEINQENYRALQREIIATENKLSALKVEASNWNKAGDALIKYGERITNISEKIESLGTNLTTKITLPTVALAGAMVSTTASFEDSMRQVAATMGITVDEIENGSESYKILEDAAQKCGETTKYSASEAAEALNYMALAGYDARQSAETLPKVLNLAAAGNLDLATASDMVTDAMAALNMETKDLDKYIDEMAKTSQKSNTSVAQLGEATLTCAGTVNLAGMTLETMNAELGILANNGIKGAEGGTHLRNIILSLTSPTDTAAKALKNLGIKVTDSSGNIRDMNDIMADFNKKLDGMSDEKKTNIISQIFNKTDISAVNALIKGSGEEFNNLKSQISSCEGAAQNMADTMNSSLKGQITLLKSQLEAISIKMGNKLMPTVKKTVEKISDLADKFSELSDEQVETILKTAGFVAAVGPALTIVGKLGSKLGSGITTLGNFSKAIANVASGVKTAEGQVGTFTKILSAMSSPIGLACFGVATAVAGISAAVYLAEKDSKEAFSNMGNAANDFISGIDNAKSHLSDFNATLFTSSEEQQNLQTQMDEVQKGITNICKTASDERRGYTQEEITQLDAYFTKLRELKQREIEIQQAISDAITQQAVTNAQTFQGSLEEYKTQSQEWLKTAEEQKTKTIELVEQQSIEMVALLNQRYGNEANMQNEAYATEYNNIMAQKQSKIDAVNAEVAEVSQAYTNGYLERAKQNDGWYSKLQEYNQKVENENQRNANNLENIQNNGLLTQRNKNSSKEQENYRHQEETKKIWKEMYKNMSEEQEKELGIWLANVAQTELYGGQIDDETKKIVSSILDSYDSMPKGTRESMKNAMEPMLTEMEKAEPGLFAKASSIANGVLSSLKKAFDIHSPSKKTREIFNFVMKGAELGLEDEEESIYKQVDNFAKGMIGRLKKIPKSYNVEQMASNLDLSKYQSALNAKIIDSTKMVFTTPQITFNVQELDEAKLKQCFNYINKKFGSKY